MIRKRLAATAIGLAAFSTLGVRGNDALAHPRADYYPNRWERDLSVDWGFVDTFPTNDWRDRVKDAAQEWNDENQPMTWVKVGDYNPFSASQCPTSYQKNGVRKGQIDGKFGTWGQTFTCVFSSDPNELYSMNIKFDEDEDWYLGTGTNPADRVDALGAATHEFGHGTGFSGPYENGHFDANAQVCTDTPRHTMCPFMAYGEQFMRNLEEHDQHTFDNAY